MSGPRAGVELVRHPDELTAGWLTAVLRDAGAASDGASVVECAPSAIGTGQMSDTYRVALEWDGGGETCPASVVVKLASADPTSRSTGIGLGIYEREIRFYREVAPRIGGPLAACHLALYDPGEGWFTLVVEDTAPSAQGDQIAGCSVEEARLAIRELARLHAPVWDDAELEAAEWLNQPSPLDGRRAWNLRARDPLLPRGGPSGRRADRGLPPGRPRRAGGLVHARARGCRASRAG